MRAGTYAILLLGVSLLCGCRKGMVEDGRVKPLAESHYLPNGMAALPPPDGTVAQGQLDEDTAFYQGEIKGRLVTGFPMVVTNELLSRGRERFDISCSACHGRTGAGNGMIPQRGFPAPPTFHQKRLRDPDSPSGYFFGAITRGYGVMYSYADRVTPADRWAITAYIRALQRSQNASPNDVPKDKKDELP